MENKDNSNITFTGDIHIAGDMFNIHDNQNVTISMNGQSNKGEKPLTVSDKEIKTAIEELLKEEIEADKLLFQNKKQWWAVYRVLKTYCNYPSRFTLFLEKMKELELSNIEEKRAPTYDSLVAAPKDVPLMTCDPASWGTLKNKSNNYLQQYLVAEYLMLKLGIKS